MEPNDNMQNDNVSEPRSVRAPGFANGEVAGGDASGVVTPVNGGNDVVFQDKPKKNHGMLYGMILLAILAAGGIGFGVWAMLDGNSREAKREEQISALKKQNGELRDRVIEMEEANGKVESETAEEQNQNEENNDQNVADRIEDTTNDEGYRVISIGDCIFDGGAVMGGIDILKCEAETSLGKGKFVWDSERRKLFFALPTDSQ